MNDQPKKDHGVPTIASDEELATAERKLAELMAETGADDEWAASLMAAIAAYRHRKEDDLRSARPDGKS